MRYVRLALLPLVFAACSDQQPAAPDIGVTPNFDATVTNEVVYLHPLRITWMDNDASAGAATVTISYLQNNNLS